MNYYIQGDAARAEEIKDAFEKLGIKASGYDFSRKDVLFFTFEAKGKTYMMSSLLGTGLDNIILTHQDYKELELPKPHYDIANFKPFQKVLVRDEMIMPVGCFYKAWKCWDCTKLWEATKDNPVEDVNVESFIQQDVYWNFGTFKELAEEMKLVLDADYSYPVIIDEEHQLVDGAHRIVHAYLDGVKTIKGVVITNDQWPEPDYDEVEAAKQYQNGSKRQLQEDI